MYKTRGRENINLSEQRLVVVPFHIRGPRSTHTDNKQRTDEKTRMKRRQRRSNSESCYLKCNSWVSCCRENKMNYIDYLN